MSSQSASDAPTQRHTTTGRSMKTSSVRGASCELCGGKIELGSEIWPIEPLPPPPPPPSDAPAPPPSKAKGFFWVHVPCARERAGGELVAPACRRWLKYGRCDFGDDCFYRHPLMEQAAATATAVAGADDEAVVTSAAAGDAERPGHGWARLGVCGSSGAGQKEPRVRKRRKRPRNASKCSTLRRFLYDHFGGAEGLRRGTGTAPTHRHRQSIHTIRLPFHPMLRRVPHLTIPHFYHGNNTQGSSISREGRGSSALSSSTASTCPHWL